MKKKRCTRTNYAPPLREIDRLTDRERIMARLARDIGRGRDVIYHGTRRLPQVLRTGKLVPASVGEPAICLSRSPETAAYFASLWGSQLDNYSPGVLVLNRRSLIHNLRLEPARYDEESDQDEREEIIWGRVVGLRRHLLGVVREADVTAILGPPKHRYLPSAFRTWSQAKRSAFFRTGLVAGDRLVRKGRAKVRELLVEERKQRAAELQRSGPRRRRSRTRNPSGRRGET